MNRIQERSRVFFIAFAFLTVYISSLQAAPVGQGMPGKLRVIFIDVEGGQATLFVTPEGRSLLIDTGWPGHDGRDADRIRAAASRTGVKKIDYVLLTHYHEDHAGGVPQLVARIPVGTFIDHGPNRELDHGITEKDYSEYQKVLASTSAKHVSAHAGETFTVGSMTVRVISADGQLVSKPLAGAGQVNSFCVGVKAPTADRTENSRSLGVELEFGQLKLLDLGDLTQDKELQLMCPTNRLGRADVYIVSHHGWYQSSNPAFVKALHARVAIMDNGEKKGGSIPTFQTLQSSPGLETLWQLHYSSDGGAQYNSDSQYIANLQGSDPGNYLELDGDRNGSFTLLNSRTGKTKSSTVPSAR